MAQAERAVQKDDRVLLGADHPWTGHTGAVHEDKGDGTLVVWLDNGFFVFAYDGQWRLLPERAGDDR